MVTVARSISYRLSANVTGWVRGLDKAADKTAETRHEVSALEKRLDQLAKKTAEPKVNLDSDEAKRRLQGVQSNLTKLGSTVAEAKARVDDADSQAKLSRIEAQLLKVGSATANPEIDLAGVAAAEADLATLTAQLQRFDGSDYRARVHVDGTLRASRGISNVVAAGLALGPALVPAAAAASGAMLGLGSAAGVAAAGAGASSLAFMGVGNALSAMAEAETAAAQNATQSAQQQVAAARQVKDAKLRLAAAERDRTQTARQGAQAIADAQREVVDARRDAAQAAEDAADQVAEAQRNLAGAHERVRLALEDLHEARRQAIRDMQDLREQTRDNALSEEAAEIRLIEARRELRKLTRSSEATSLDLRKARLDVAQAEDRLSDVHREARRNQAALNEVEGEGIRSADAVVAARRNVRDAEEGVADAKRALAEAVEAQAEQQRESSRSIAEAQRNLARTREQVATRNQEAARQVAQAQRGLQRALADVNRTMSETSSEVDKLREKMAALSPAGRDFVRFLFSLRPKLEELQRIAQEGMFPGVEAGIRDLLELFPILERLVDNSSTSLGNLAREAGEALTSPFWRDFFNWLADEAGPKLDKFGRITGNVATGFAGLAMASDELADGFVDDLLRMSRHFAQWGKQLEESDEFRRFVDYVQRVSPKVWKTIGAIADALLALAEAAAPVGEFTLPIIRGLARAFAAVMRSPAGPVIVGIAVALTTLNTAVRGYRKARYSALVTSIGNIGENARTARGRLGRLARFIGTGGPWGAALAVGITALGIWAQEQAEAEQRVDELRDSLDKQTGAFTRNSKQKIINTLLTEGALQAARNLGISIETVTRAAFGERDAIRKVRKELDKHTQAVGGAMVSTERYTGDAKRLSDVLFGQHSVTAKARKEFWLLKAANKAMSKESNKAEKQGRQHETQLKDVGRQLNRTEKQTRQLIDEYGRVPNNVRTFFNADTKQARKKIGALSKFTNRELNAMKDRVLNIEFTGGLGGAASGGQVRGPGTGTSDSVPIRASRGEWVIREKAASEQGSSRMSALNSGRADIVPRFARGGPVMDDFEKVDLKFRASRSGFASAFDELARRMAISGGGRGLAFARRQDGEPYVWGGVGPFGWDCCTRPGTAVLGPDGAKNIEDLNPDDMVWSFVDGELVPSKVTAAWRSKDQPIYRLRTRNRDAYASANHPFLRLTPEFDPCTLPSDRSGRDAEWTTEWVRLDQLQRGDLIVTFQGTEESASSERETDDSVPPDLAWLLGLFVADGYLNQDALRICVYGDEAARVIAVAERYWHRKCKNYPRHGVTIHKASAARWMRAHGFDAKSHEKRVPECVWMWTVEAQRAFLEGYADGDGHRPPPERRAGSGDVVYKATSWQLMSDVRALHTLLGDGVANIVSEPRTKPIHIGGKLVKNARTVYSFSVRYGKRATSWLTGGSSKTPKGARALVRSWDPAFGVQPILDIEEMGESPTYDIEVDGSHNFVADGVVVHNSGLWSGAVNAIRGRDPNTRLFSTASFAGGNGVAGFVRGLASPVMIGVDPGSHMAGSIGGVNIESSGSHGVRVGGGARGPFHPMFDYQFGLSGVRGIRRARNRGIANEGILADRGALLPQGVSLVRNATGDSEHVAVFTDEQWRSLRAIATAVPRTVVSGGDGASVVNNYYVTTTPQATAGEIIRETLHVARVQRAGGRSS